MSRIPAEDGASRGVRRRRDSAVRITRYLIAGIAAGALGLSGALSAVAAHAFKGRARPAAPARSAQRAAAPGPHVNVPGPQSIPSIANQPAPLQPPAQPPSAPAPEPAGSAPAPQVSGGS